MKKRYTEEQIIGAIKEHESGAKVDDICHTSNLFCLIVALPPYMSIRSVLKIYAL